jgi:hypothetical protein
MMLTGTFDITSWNETPYDTTGDQPKCTRTAVEQTFIGDIEGESVVEYLMTYTSESSARFVGQQRIVGSIGERAGSFVLQFSGTFDGETARATWTVVEGSGTGDLMGITGQGGFDAPLGDDATYSLDVNLDM